MVELDGTDLVFRFPDTHADAECRVSFQRTLRIPDDNRDHPLPPSFGRFPMRHVEDLGAGLPEAVARRGGVILPMYQAEALWIDFDHGYPGYPVAIRIGAGKINVVTGEPWRDELAEDREDFVVVPGQPWLDGFSTGEGLVRQFVAMPLGAGYTAEEQLTGEGVHGGLQIAVHPMKSERYEVWKRAQEECLSVETRLCTSACLTSEMGLAPGGLMRQAIYRSDLDFDVWETDVSSRCFVHLLNSERWKAVTGDPVPTPPVTAADYTRAGLPWFEYFDESRTAVAGSPELAGLDSVAALGIKKGESPLPENEPVGPQTTIRLHASGTSVSDGRW